MAAPTVHEPTRLSRLALLAAAYIIPAVLCFAWSYARSTPFGFADELVYGRVAQNLGFGEGFTYQGLSASAYKTLYPFVIAPAWAVTDDHRAAYHLALVVNALLMPLACLPAYAIARRVAPFRWAVVAALAAGLTPAMAWSSMLMTEALAYPLAALALWAAVVALARPGGRTAAVALVAAAAAGTARTQMLAMLPVFGLAVVLDVARYGRGWRTRARQHRWSLGFIGGGMFVGAAVLWAGGSDGVLGTYSGELRRGSPVGEVLGYLPRYLPVLAVSTLLMPFLALLALATSPARWREPELGPVLAVAVAAVVVFLIVGAWASATLSPELRERYVFYPAAVLPAIWVALWTRREQLPLAVATVALFALLAPVVAAVYEGGSAEWVGYTVDSLLRSAGLSELTPPGWLGGRLNFWALATAGMGLATLLALGAPRRRLAGLAFVLPPLIFGAAVVSARELQLDASSAASYAAHVRPPDVVDRLGDGPAAFVRTPGSRLEDAWYLELWNRRLDRVWRVPSVGAENSIGQACPLVRARGRSLRLREACAGRGLARWLVFDDATRDVRVDNGRRRFAEGSVSVWELPPGDAPRITLTPRDG